MKKRTLLNSFVLFFFILLAIAVTKPHLLHSTEAIKSAIENDHPYKENHETALSGKERHARDAALIHDTGALIRQGNDNVRVGEYLLAVEAYEKAYSLDRGFRALSGLKLVTTYEKLGRYDDGISLLDQMIQNGELSENGVKNANEIKARLIAAKAASQR